MVLTTIDYLKRYASLSPYFSAAFAALTGMAEGPFERGRKAVDGENVFVVGLEYDTHPTDGALMEVHRTYIDVMWMVSGQEQMAVCPVEQMTQLTQPYDAVGDAALGHMPTGCSMLRMEPGTVCILFPEDAHAPGLDVCGTSHVQKLIAKVRVV